MSVEETLLKKWWVYPGFELEVVATGFDLPMNTAEISSVVTNTRKSPSTKITPSTAGSAAPKLLSVLKNDPINVIGALVSFFPNFMASLPYALTIF